MGKVSLSVIIFIPFLWLLAGYIYKEHRVSELTNEKYKELSQEMQNELQTLINEKSETVLIIAMAISQNPQIKNILLHNDGLMELNHFSKELRDNTSLKNIWFQIISADGTSMYRSWTNNKGDNLKNIRIDIDEMLESPQINSSISVGKFDIAFKSMVPMFEQEKFIGFVEVVAKFNSVAIKMEQKNFDTVIVVDKSYRSQLTNAFTKKFIQDYYIANTNAKPHLLELLAENKLDEIVKLRQAKVFHKDSLLLSVYTLKDIHENDMSYFLLFLDLNKIDMSSIQQTQERLFIFIFSIFLFIVGVYYYLYINKYRTFIQNINEQLEHEVHKKTKELHHLANHDTLTGLPNRLLFLDRLSQSIKHAKRNHSNISVLFLDLDRFKEVNDTFGHDVGDQLLQEVSKKISKSIREEDTISRLGGDEFTIILSDLKEEDIIQTTQKIITLMQEKFKIDNKEIYTTFSIGISNFPQDGDTPEILLRNADTAMYKAKELGKNQFQFYNATMTQVALQRAQIERDIRSALERDEFIPYFQPKIDTQNNRIIGMETLIRWNHPKLGFIMPSEFISIAEETGLIIPIDRFMMKKTLQIIKKWIDEGLHIGVLSLNLSIKQLEDISCIETLRAILSNHNIEAKYLELEITESQIMSNPKSAIEMLNHIKELGISLSVDDFGTGYSSLSYLKRLPIDTLKIDRSFISELPQDKEDVAIVKAIIALAQSLNMNTVAEGVETQEQLDFLVSQGCYNIQGYYYSKPLPEDEYKDFLLQYQ